MGRPLYLRNPFQAPIVRVEPEPEAYPAPQKWSYWNRFDPDADEFFQSADAVYEAVLDTSRPPVGIQRTGDSDRTTLEEPSSDESSTERDSPLDESSDMDMDEDWALHQRIIPPRRFVERSLQARPAFGAAPTADETAQPGDPSFDRLIPTNILDAFSPERRSTSLLSNTSASSNTPISAAVPPRTPSPIPVMLPLEHSLEQLDPIHAAARGSMPTTPSTPPNRHSIPYDTPSPAPTVSPRLFQYRIRPVAAVPISVSPTSPGPLTNHGARRSVAHISPVRSLVPVHRIVG